MLTRTCTRMALVLALVLAVAAPLRAEEWVDDHGESGAWGDVSHLVDEVGTLNLVNGLNLGTDQLEQIIALAAETKQLREAYFARQERLALDYRARLVELREILARPDPTIPASCEQQIHAAEHAIRVARGAYHDALRDVEQRLLEALTPGQLLVIRGFNPCVIPPQDLKDPVRVGQAAGEFADIELQLDHLRNLPPRAFEVIVDPLLEKMLQEWSHILAFTPEEHVEERERMRSVLEKARSLDDVTFKLRLPGLAREVVRPILDFRDKSTEMGQFFARFGAVSKPGKWLLNPDAIPLLEAKLKALAARPQAAVGKSVCSCGSCAACDAALAPCPCGKPTFAGFCNRFGVPEEAREGLRFVLARAQVEMLDILCRPRDDGTVPLALLLQDPQELHAIVTQLVPGEKRTYASRIDEIKRRIHEAIRVRVENKQYQAFLRSGVDVFDVHAGNLNRYAPRD